MKKIDNILAVHNYAKQFFRLSIQEQLLGMGQVIYEYLQGDHRVDKFWEPT